MRNLNNI